MKKAKKKIKKKRKVAFAKASAGRIKVLPVKKRKTKKAEPETSDVIFDSSNPSTKNIFIDQADPEPFFALPKPLELDEFKKEMSQVMAEFAFMPAPVKEIAPIENNPENPPKKHFISTIIITTISAAVIIILAFLFYYYSVKTISLPTENSVSFAKKESAKKPPVSQIIPTNVINFMPPAVLPTNQESGSCWTNSIAEPFRADAWRCIVGNGISDPCFTTAQKGFVFCQENPLKPDSVLIKLTKPLPAASLPPVLQDNWAWFLTLKDGIFCAPFTGTRPFFGTGPSAQIAYYGCNSNDKNQRIYLLGDLTKGNVWTATEAISTKNGGSWTISSTQQVDIDTVWK